MFFPFSRTPRPGRVFLRLLRVVCLCPQSAHRFPPGEEDLLATEVEDHDSKGQAKTVLDLSVPGKKNFVAFVSITKSKRKTAFGMNEQADFVEL